MGVSGTTAASGNMRTSNLGGVSGWGVFSAGAVACDDTFAYCLYTNVTNSNIGGGTPDCHLLKIPWATWTVAGATLLQSFARVTGTAGSENGLARRASDGLLAGRLHGSDIYTFDPTAAYAPTRLGSDAFAPSATLMSITFDPTDPTVIWTAGFNSDLRRWKIGTGDLGVIGRVIQLYTVNASPSGQLVGAAGWDASNAPKGVQIVDPVLGLVKCPLGLRWISADRSGASNGNHTEGTLANRAAISSCRDAVMDKDGIIYAVSTVSAALGVRRLTADWLTADAISTAAISAPTTTSHIAVSPDATKVVVSIGEQLLKIT